jgi:hypothetical protein
MKETIKALEKIMDGILINTKQRYSSDCTEEFNEYNKKYKELTGNDYLDVCKERRR